MASEENKAKVVETALRMFNERGLKGVTMDDIAAELRMSKRTLYEVFANKEALLSECLMLVHDRMERAHRRTQCQGAEPLLMAMYMLRVGADATYRYHRLIAEAERYYPEIHDRYFKIHTDAMRTMLRKGMDYVKSHNYLRADADVEVAIDFLCNLVQERRISEMADPQSHKRRLNEICFTYLRGLMTTETITRYEQQEESLRTMLEKLKVETEYNK